MVEYDSLNEAVYQAAAAARAAYEDRYEAISVVYELDGKFFFTPPYTSGQKSGANTRANVKFPKGAQLRFIVHNHPSGAGASTFSQEDIEVAERLGLPSAIVFGRDEPTIRVFHPGTTSTRTAVDKGTRRAVRISDGDPFDWPPAPQEPDEEHEGLMPTAMVEASQPRRGLLPQGTQALEVH